MRTITTVALAFLLSLTPSLAPAQQSTSNSARPRLESERLRQELLVLLADVRSASDVLNARSSYDEFMLRLDRIGKRLSSIRSKYQGPLGRGDHKALGVPIADACTALYASASDWKHVRLAANEVASTQSAIARAAPWEVDFYQGQLRAAQVKHSEAQRRLADRTGTTLALVQAATRAQEESKKQAVAARK
jgi:hypothetical protein